MIEIKTFGSLNEVAMRLNHWAKKFNLNNFFIQIVPMKPNGFVVFYDSRLDDLE
jgi:hypothetical protein